MDTISRENNSILPIAGVIAGALALLLAIVALFKLSATGKDVGLLKEEMTSRIGSVEGQISSAAADAASATKLANRLQGDTQSAFQQVAGELGSVRGELTKIQESLTKPKAVVAGSPGAKTPKEPAVAGPDEYLVKAGDNGMKIAKSNGTTIADLNAVNPGINWSKLKVGDKLKLPKK